MFGARPHGKVRTCASLQLNSGRVECQAYSAGGGGGCWGNESGSQFSRREFGRGGFSELLAVECTALVFVRLASIVSWCRFWLFRLH